MPAIEQLVFGGDELELTLLPGLGCRLHRLRAFGVDLLRTPPEPATHAADPFFWGGYVMAPWTNRATPGPMRIAGRTVDLPSNFRDGTAIHGQVYLRPWQRTGDATFAIGHEGDGWPWAYEVRAEVGVDGSRLRLAYRLTNHSSGSMPGGIGLHPWLRRPVEVALSARAVHPDNGDPTAVEVAAAGPWALSRAAVPRSGLDASWLDLDPAEVRLRWPLDGLAAVLSISTDGGSAHVAVASPDQPDAVAVEPVTHVPWALDRLAAGRAGGMALLASGASLALRLELTLRRD